MAIESKNSFINQLELKLSSSVPADTMSLVLMHVSDILESFDLTEIANNDSSSDDLLNGYLAAMTVEGKSQKTIDRYSYVLKRMADAVKVPTRQISVYHLRNYLASEKQRGISDSTLEGIREIFSAYFNWLQRESLIDKNPTANLGTIKCAKKEKKIYSDVDFEKLCQNCTHLRDKAIIHFLKATGCRISEMTDLNRDNVDLTRQECAVHGKGNKERTVFIDSVTVMFLSDYLSGRTDGNPALFVGKGAKRLQPGGVRAMLSELEKRSGVDHVHPHKFRRTLATELARKGMPVQEVAKILGHEKLDTTMQYIELDKDDVKQSYRRHYAC